MMDDKDRKIFRLQQEKESLVLKHNEEKSELKGTIDSLKSELKIKRRTENIDQAYTLKYFPAAVIKLLEFVDPSQFLADFYIKASSLINYMIVAGIGVAINMFVIHRLVNIFPLWLANLGAIFIAFVFNWTFSVGPLGYLFGFPKRVTENDDL